MKKIVYVPCLILCLFTGSATSSPAQVYEDSHASQAGQDWYATGIHQYYRGPVQAASGVMPAGSMQPVQNANVAEPVSGQYIPPTLYPSGNPAPALENPAAQSSVAQPSVTPEAIQPGMADPVQPEPVDGPFGGAETMEPAPVPAVPEPDDSAGAGADDSPFGGGGSNPFDAGGGASNGASPFGSQAESEPVQPATIPEPEMETADAGFGGDLDPADDGANMVDGDTGGLDPPAAEDAVADDPFAN